MNFFKKKSILKFIATDINYIKAYLYSKKKIAITRNSHLATALYITKT